MTVVVCHPIARGATAQNVRPKTTASAARAEMTAQKRSQVHDGRAGSVVENPPAPSVE